MANPMKPLRDPSQGVQKQFSVAIVLEDGFAVVAAGGDVVKRTVVLDSRRTRFVGAVPFIAESSSSRGESQI
jgi:hypothetical protein